MVRKFSIKFVFYLIYLYLCKKIEDMAEVKKTRIEFVYDQFSQLYEKAIRKDKLLTPINSDKLLKLTSDGTAHLPKLPPIKDNYIDITFFDYYTQTVNNDLLINTYLDKGTFKDVIFQYFLDFDPTPNKEYISWFVKLYSDLIKDRPQINQINRTGTLFTKATIRKENFFFEDFGKIAEALETFAFIKKTAVLTTKQRDINQYDSYNSFIATVKPYMVSDKNDDSVDVHTLTHSEIKCIQNFVNKSTTLEAPMAELVLEEEDWLIIVTHNYQANTIFGKNTTWCTAGTKYGNSFENYHKQGSLFVLINKGHGSRKSIQTNPLVRLQFHFESEQFMDALDKPIDIGHFLSAHQSIKDYFRQYVVDVVQKGSINNYKNFDTERIISYLTKLGYIDQLIPILKDSKAQYLSLNNIILETSVVEALGEITSLKELSLIGSNLKEIPETFKNLVNLEKLDVSCNKGITELPKFINDLKGLVELDISNCNIKNGFDVSELTNLLLLLMDNNPELTQLPKNIYECKSLARITASCCNLEGLVDEIIYLNNLYMIDVHNNPNLTYVPVDLTKMEKLIACNLHQTNISDDVSDILGKNAIAKKIKCSFYGNKEKKSKVKL